MRRTVKILILSHKLTSSHPASVAIEAGAGNVVFYSTSVNEAWQILQFQGDSLDAMLVQLEGEKTGETPGIELISRVRGDPTRFLFPIVAISETWSQEEFSKHRSGPTAVDAYLKFPIEGADSLETWKKFLGQDYPVTTSASSPISSGGEIELSLDGPKEVSLSMDASGLFVSNQQKFETGVVIPAVAHNKVPHETVTSGGRAIEDLRTIFLIPELLPGTEPSVHFQFDGKVVETTAFTVTNGRGLPLAVPELPKEVGLFSDPGIPEQPIELDKPAPVFDASSVNLSMSRTLPPPEVIEEKKEEAPIEVALEAASVSEPEVHEEKPTFTPSSSMKEAAGLEKELPYLFTPSQSIPAGALPYASLGAALIPGMAGQDPDQETLKKFLELRERDVVALSNQLHAAMKRVGELESSLVTEKAMHAEVLHAAKESKAKLEDYDRAKASEMEEIQAKNRDLEFQLKTRDDRMKGLEKQAHAATTEIEKIKERVRADLLRIRTRERELENRLEILKADSEALIASRESKIVELKRRTDLLEFNMDLVQSQFAREKEIVAKLRSRLLKATQAVRVAEGLLEEPGAPGIGTGAQSTSEIIVTEKEARKIS